MANVATYQQWALHYVLSTSLEDKLTPPPDGLRWEDDAPPSAPAAPGRPAAFTVADCGHPTPGKQALRDVGKRAQLTHTFWHHELQAAELMCWAVLAYPDTPASFKRGLIAICRDEIRHMKMYADYLNGLGYQLGDFSVRDWFWLHLPKCPTPLSFVATMGVGLEGGNLDHTARFAARFRSVGDDAGADLQEQVGREEIPHVRFALHWFRRWSSPKMTEGGAANAASDQGDCPDRSGPLDCEFDRWRQQLPPPLSPILMRGRPLARKQREQAGMTAVFTDALATWKMDDPRNDGIRQ